MKPAGLSLALVCFAVCATMMLCACSESENDPNNEAAKSEGDVLVMPIFAKKGQGANQSPKNIAARITARGSKKSLSISQGITSGENGNIVSGTNLTGSFAGTFDPFNYVVALQEKIKQSWQINPAFSTKSGVVGFSIDHTGSVSNLVIKESSGSSVFDKSMLEAVQRAVPMPPLVASAPAKVQAEFTFNERLLRGLENKDDLKKIVAEQGAAIERNADDCLALMRRARANTRLANYGSAVQDYKRVLSKTTDNVEALLERAKCYLYMDDYKDALEDCLAGENINPNLAKSFVLAAAAQLGLGKLAEAHISLDAGIALNPTDPEAWALRANCDNLLLKHQNAIEDASKAIALDPQYGSAYAYRGDGYEALKDYDAALRDYSKNVDLDPDHAQSFMRRTELYSTLGQYDKAVFDATEAIRLAPATGEAFYYRAHANEELGLKAQAQNDLARAKQLGL